MVLLVDAECAEVVEAVGGGSECLDVACGVDEDGGSVRMDGKGAAGAFGGEGFAGEHSGQN